MNRIIELIKFRVELHKIWGDEMNKALPVTNKYIMLTIEEAEELIRAQEEKP